MSDREIQELLLRYRHGNCTADEITRIHLWYESLNKNFSSSLDFDEKSFLEEKLLAKISHEIEQPTLRIYEEEPVNPKAWWKSTPVKYGIAASVILLLGLSFLFKKSQEHVAMKSESLVIHSQKGNLKSSLNSSKSVQRIRLEDNSLITLSPGSRISYPNVFSDDKREVQLEGDAFFEISKNPAKPFFVYSGKLVTKVLGTSFWVKTNEETFTTEVEVITGKVSVFENHFLSNINSRKLGKGSQGVVLTPNQKVSYYEESGHLLTSIVEEPMIIPENDTPVNLVFNNESLSYITAALQKEYGIEIVFANDLLEKCTFTGDISEIPLYDKLELICKANTACYEIKGTRILISGNGCD
ncbi:FecR family protein [Dyadobacter frigoris]|uniref:FecR family protein n=1 Tax=Dyadobacter frigoris TaxID=2576211 RepID=A0A4U6D2L5_9BACT|nr:FecR family protein [Dyadobacter frigoris]TKT88104.1 FecR family protein [Dyadobacter frigoris]GLU53716.1 anti-sigma factor [Dyadobacter frigoris]